MINERIRVRLRPIILTTTLGFLTMAIELPDYSIVWGAMASTFVTGFISATFLTLIIIPVLWDMVQSRQERQAG